MPAGIKPPQCVGVKGKSGRKSAPVEFAKTQAIIKAWNKINKEIDDKDVEKIALPIALKTMADRSEIEQKVIVTEMSEEEFQELYNLYGNKPKRVSSSDDGERH